MVNKCCIPGCKWNYKSMKTNVPFTVITVFSFPKNDVLRKEWIRRIPRDLTITKTTFICVKHFEEDDIIRYKSHRFKNIPDPKVSL